MRTALPWTEGQNETDPQNIFTGQNSLGNKEISSTLSLASYSVDLCGTKRYERCVSPLHMARFLSASWV